MSDDLEIEFVADARTDAMINNKGDYPKIEVECPEEVVQKVLLYWDGLLRPQEGVLVHPEDVSAHLELRAAIKLLLEFCGGEVADE